MFIQNSDSCRETGKIVAGSAIDKASISELVVNNIKGIESSALTTGKDIHRAFDKFLFCGNLTTKTEAIEYIVRKVAKKFYSSHNNIARNPNVIDIMSQ